MDFRVGQIVGIKKFPYSDKEEEKARPGLIIAIPSEVKNTYVVAQITTKPKDDPYCIPLDEDMVLMSLREKSYVRCQIVFTCKKSMMSDMPYGSLTTKGEIKIRQVLQSIFPLPSQKVEQEDV